MTDEGDPSGGALGERTCCLSCGYLLRGLPRPVCPECGLAFDPLDSKTFGTGPDSRARRKWLIRGAMGLAALGLLLVPLFPRGYSKSTITFVCKKCGGKTTVERWELYAADWSRIRFPGYSTSPSASTASPMQQAAPCDHVFSVTVAAKYSLFTFNGVAFGGSTSAFGDENGGLVVFNGVAARPETSSDVLRALVRRRPDGSFGVWVGKVSDPSEVAALSAEDTALVPEAPAE